MEQELRFGLEELRERNNMVAGMIRQLRMID